MNTSRLSLNQFLMWSGTGIVAVLILPLGIYLVLTILHFSEGAITRHGESLARILASQVVDPLLVEDKLQLADILEKVSDTDKNITYICIENSRGEIVSHTFKNGFPKDLRKIWINGGAPVKKFRTGGAPMMDISAPILSGQLGNLHIGLSRSFVTKSLRHLYIVLSLLIAVALMLIFIDAWFVTRNVSRPIGILEREVSGFTLDRAAQSPLEIRGIREVESLARGFNEMVSRLANLEHERSLIQAKMVQTESMSALGTMAAGLAHEIRNPLDGMLECVRYLEADPAKGDRQTKFLPMIREGLERINNVMTHMLIFARSGEIPSTEATRTTEIFSSLETMLEGKLKSRNIHLTWKKPGTCACLCNKIAVVHALLNLVLNAIDGVLEKDNPEIIIEATCDANWVYLTVEDSGDGVAPGLETKIFEPFYTTKCIGKGTGLGLSISRQLIRAAGGDLSLSANPSPLGGARFEIRIPRIYPKECDCA